MSELAAQQIEKASKNTLENLLDLKDRVGSLGLNSVYVTEDGILGIKHPPSKADYSFTYHDQPIKLKIQSLDEQSILQIWAPLGQIYYSAECRHSRHRTIDIINAIPPTLETKYVVTERQNLLCLYEVEIDNKTWTDDMLYMTAKFIKQNRPFIDLLKPILKPVRS